MYTLKNNTLRDYIFKEVDIVLPRDSSITVDKDIVQQLLKTNYFKELYTANSIQLIGYGSGDNVIQLSNGFIDKSVIVDKDVELIANANLILTNNHLKITLPEQIRSGDLYAVYCPMLYSFEIWSNSNSDEQQIICDPFESVKSKKGETIRLISITNSGNLLLFLGLNNKLHFLSQNSCRYDLNRGTDFDLVYQIEKDNYKGNYIINTGSYTKEVNSMLHLKNVLITDTITQYDSLSLKFQNSLAYIDYLDCFSTAEWLISFDIYPELASLDNKTHYIWNYADILSFRISKNKFQYKVYPNSWRYGLSSLQEQWYSVQIESKDKIVTAKVNENTDLELSRSKIKTTKSRLYLGAYKSPSRYPFIGYVSNIKIKCYKFEEMYNIRDIIPVMRFVK